MTANGRWDLIRRLKVNELIWYFLVIIICLIKEYEIVCVSVT